MPWKDLRPVDERVLFVADYVRELYDFSELCARYGVSRKTGYKWVERYRHEGVEGLPGAEVARRPQSAQRNCPTQSSAGHYPVARQPSHASWGAKKIRERGCGERHPDQTVTCAHARCYNVLKRAGLIAPRHLATARGALRALWCRRHQGSQWTVER